MKENVSDVNNVIIEEYTKIEEAQRIYESLSPKSRKIFDVRHIANARHDQGLMVHDPKKNKNWNKIEKKLWKKVKKGQTKVQKKSIKNQW